MGVGIFWSLWKTSSDPQGKTKKAATWAALRLGSTTHRSSLVLLFLPEDGSIVRIPSGIRVVKMNDVGVIPTSTNTPTFTRIYPLPNAKSAC
jgi:hypothetical protein